MASKLRRTSDEKWIFYCPGCQYHHYVDARWTFNGDQEQPTFTPSVHVGAQHEEIRCHFFVKDGKIEYLMDCHHELKGQTVEMEDEE